VEGAEGKVLYVWFDAPIGYISNTIELLPDEWEKWWKSKETKLVHFIGKDNIVFHCIVFPSMLKAYGDGYILPDNVPANEFLNLEGEKISTSQNWAVWLHEYLEDFPGQQDVLRYALCANAPETKDNDFTWKEFQRDCGLGLNAGHDLSLQNLAWLKKNIPWLDEVSIGHALVCDALYLGLEKTIKEYKKCII
jgi:methionyl-tRNA synthetase